MKPKDTHHRRLALLQHLPRYPRKASTRDLISSLGDQGFDVTIRTIQRDLEFLSGTGLFGIGSDKRNKPTGWFWMRNASGSQIPFMDLHTAVSFNLLRHLSARLWPASIRSHMQPYFVQAQTILEKRKSWSDKVVFSDKGLTVSQPQGSCETQEIIYRALDEGRCISAQVGRSLGGMDLSYMEYSCIHPLGLHVVEKLVFLIAKVGRHKMVRFPIHRLRNATLLPQTVEPPDDFNLHRFLATDPFSHLFEEGVRLELEVNSQLAIYLKENPLGWPQHIQPKGKGIYTVEATVDDTAELRATLLSYGASVRVIGPSKMKAYMQYETQRIAVLYATPACDNTPSDSRS